MYKGIDVSDNQGTIDWAKVKAAGCQFAILRSVRRSGKPDNQFAVNAAGCLVNRIPIEVYKYTYAMTEAASALEAQQVIELLIGYGLACRVWWDVEDKLLRPLDRPALTGVIKTAERVIMAAGFEFGIYTGKSFYKEKVFHTDAFSCPMWIARYPLTSSFALADDLPADKYKPVTTQQLVAWQYTSKGRVDGINSFVDLNDCYVPFWTDQPAAEYYLQEIWHGTSISKALESIGVDGSYQHREQIAAANGITGYSGTAVQNTHMLNLLRTGQLVRG